MLDRWLIAVHPRGTELLLVLSGNLTVGHATEDMRSFTSSLATLDYTIFPKGKHPVLSWICCPHEDSVLPPCALIRTLRANTASKVNWHPAGLAHFYLNQGCSPVLFDLILNDENAGTAFLKAAYSAFDAQTQQIIGSLGNFTGPAVANADRACAARRATHLSLQLVAFRDPGSRARLGLWS